MSTKTLGTTAQTSLVALQFQPYLAPADLATINADIYQDSNPANNTTPTAAPTSLSTSGILTFPGRDGYIQLLPGDYIAVDPTTGWPIVVSANCAANGAIVHS
jgi:hypothetical protein